MVWFFCSDPFGYPFKLIYDSIFTMNRTKLLYKSSVHGLNQTIFLKQFGLVSFVFIFSKTVWFWKRFASVFPTPMANTTAFCILWHLRSFSIVSLRDRTIIQNHSCGQTWISFGSNHPPFSCLTSKIDKFSGIE